MNKKGFTLIEIIVCIALITVGGFFSIYLTSSKNNDLDKITNKILEAALVYSEVEKDKNGNSYIKKVQNGSKGVTIPLQTLVNTGYIKQSDLDKVKNVVKYSNQDDYYVLLALTTDLCESGSIFTKASWDIGDEPIYLCDKITAPEDSCGLEDENTVYGKIQKEYLEKGISGCVPGQEDGLCYFYSKGKVKNDEGIYYYAGNVNNVLKIGEDLYYIVRTTEGNGVKLISKETVDFGGLNINVNLTGDDYTFKYLKQDNSTMNFTFYGGLDRNSKGNVTYEMSKVNISSNTYWTRWDVSYDLLTENLNKYNVWNDATDYTYKLNCDSTAFKQHYVSDRDYVPCSNTKFKETITLKNKYYTHLYFPIKTWYESRSSVLDLIIKNDYLWCNKSVGWGEFSGWNAYLLGKNDFSCADNNYEIGEKFGMLNYSEYKAILKYNSSLNELYDDDNYFINFSYYGITPSNYAGGDFIFDIQDSYYPVTSLQKNTRGYYYSSFSGTADYGSVPKIVLRPSIVIKGDLIIESGEGTEENPYVLKID